MNATPSDRRWLWMSVGLAAGLAIATVWPHEPAAASVADRNDKFAMVTAQTSTLDLVEAVFVLDFLTGQLRGASLNNSTGTITLAYARNVAADFNVDPSSPGNYAIVSGKTNLPSARGTNPAASSLYIAELNSGKVICYAFPYQTTNRPVPAALPLTPVATFPFREAVME